MTSPPDVQALVQGHIAFCWKGQIRYLAKPNKIKIQCVTGRSVDSIPVASSPLSVLSCGATSPGDDAHAAVYANHAVSANTCAPPAFAFSQVPLQLQQALQAITSIAQEDTDEVTPHSISAVSHEGRRRHMFPTLRNC